MYVGILSGFSSNTFFWIIITTACFEPALFLIIRTGIADVPSNYQNSATRSVDYNMPSDDIIQFEENESSKTVTISITQDNDYEGPEEFTVMLEPVSSDEQPNIGYPNKARIFISDDCT